MSDNNGIDSRRGPTAPQGLPAAADVSLEIAPKARIAETSTLVKPVPTSGIPAPVIKPLTLSEKISQSVLGAFEDSVAETEGSINKGIFLESEIGAEVGATTTVVSLDRTLNGRVNDALLRIEEYDKKLKELPGKYKFPAGAPYAKMEELVKAAVAERNAIMEICRKKLSRDGLLFSEASKSSPLSFEQLVARYSIANPRKNQDARTGPALLEHILLKTGTPQEEVTQACVRHITGAHYFKKIPGGVGMLALCHDFGTLGSMVRQSRTDRDHSKPIVRASEIAGGFAGAYAGVKLANGLSRTPLHYIKHMNQSSKAPTRPPPNYLSRASGAAVLFATAGAFGGSYLSAKLGQKLASDQDKMEYLGGFLDRMANELLDPMVTSFDGARKRLEFTPNEEDVDATNRLIERSDPFSTSSSH